MQVIVMTSDKYENCLEPFMWLWQKYFTGWPNAEPLDLVFCGFTAPKADLWRYGWRFHSIGAYEDYPPKRWSDAFLKVLDEVAEDRFVLMLEDYWLCRQVDTRGVKMLYDYAGQFENVLKIDLMFDRLYINGGSNFLYGQNTYAHCGYLDLIKSPQGTDYQMSLWTGIWRRDVMRRFIVPGEKAQEIEMYGTSRVNRADDILVLGTRQGPMSHGNIYRDSRDGPSYADSGWAIDVGDLGAMRAKGWIE